MKFEQLMEAPLPDDWDKSVYQQPTSFKDMVAYAKERAAQVATTLLGAYKGSKLGYLMSKNINTKAEKDLIEILNIVDGRDRLIVKMLEEIEKATIKNPQITEEEMATVVFSYDARIEKLTSEMVRKANQFKQSHLSNPSLPKREEFLRSLTMPLMVH